MWWTKKVEDPRKQLRNKLAAICDNATIEKNSIVNDYNDSLSLVCFVNADIPKDKQIAHVAECMADYMFFFGQKSISQEWHERQNQLGKRNKIICFEVPFEDMNALYGDHMKVMRESRKSLFHNVSAITYGGQAYPIAFCLGMVWGNKLTAYKKYNSFSI